MRVFSGKNSDSVAVTHRLVVALIVIAAIVVMQGSGSRLSFTFSNIVANLDAS